MLILPPGALKDQNVHIIFVGGKHSLVTGFSLDRWSALGFFFLLPDSPWHDPLHWLNPFFNAILTNFIYSSCHIARKGRVRKDLLSSVPGIKLRGNAVIFQHRTGLTWERGKFSRSCRFFFMAWLYHLFRSFAISPNIRHLHTQMPFKVQAGLFLS